MMGPLFGLFLFAPKNGISTVASLPNDDGHADLGTGEDVEESSDADIDRTALLSSMAAESSGNNKPRNMVREYTTYETLTSLDFYLLWIAHFCGTANGLFYLNNIAQMEQAMGGTKASAALYVSIAGVFNAFGRMAAGFLSDRYAGKISRPLFFAFALVSMSIGQASMAVFPGNGWMYVAGAMVGFTYGTFWALIPPMTIELFGEKHVGLNYQLFGLAPAAGSVLANIVLASNVYESHVIKGTTLCCGRACFQLTHVVLAIMSLCGVCAAVCVHFRTRIFYQQQQEQRQAERLQ